MNKKWLCYGFILYSSLALSKTQSQLIVCLENVEGLGQKISVNLFFKKNKFYHEKTNLKVNEKGGILSYTLLAYPDECHQYLEHLKKKPASEQECEETDSFKTDENLNDLIKNVSEIDRFLHIGPDTLKKALALFDQPTLYGALPSEKKQNEEMIYLVGVNDQGIEKANIPKDVAYMQLIGPETMDSSTLLTLKEDLENEFPDLEIHEPKIWDSQWPGSKQKAKRFAFTYTRKNVSTPTKAPVTPAPEKPVVLTSNNSKVPDKVELVFVKNSYYCRQYCNGENAKQTCSIPLTGIDSPEKASKACEQYKEQKSCTKDPESNNYKC